MKRNSPFKQPNSTKALSLQGKIFIYHSVILVVLLLLFSACQSQKEQLASTDYKLNSKKTISIAIDNSTANIQLNTQYLEKTNELVILNKKTNTLQFYDFEDKGKLTKKIALEQEGDNGVGMITNFLVHTQDSIFVLDAPLYKLSLIDGKGIVKNTYEVFNREKNAKNATPDPFPLAPLVLIDNKMHIASSPPPSGPMNEKYYASTGCVIILDLKTKKFDYKYTFPKVYQQNIYPSILTMFHRTYSQKHKKFIHSFSADHHLQVTDYQTNTQYLANSKQLQVVATLEKKLSDGKESNKIGNQTSQFMGVYYDKFRDIFYRIFVLKQPKMDDKYGLIILNTNFEKIGEIARTPDKLFPYNPIFTKAGMWLPKVDKDIENAMMYELCELVKN